ncbi:MAG TPA: hypothetical protein VJ924_13285 [Alphaproteobacteria bacterium]|nr:hypothetical protein [Alphaproteobacteria bacterium]
MRVGWNAALLLLLLRGLRLARRRCALRRRCRTLLGARLDPLRRCPLLRRSDVSWFAAMDLRQPVGAFRFAARTRCGGRLRLRMLFSGSYV